MCVDLELSILHNQIVGNVIIASEFGNYNVSLLKLRWIREDGEADGFEHLTDALEVLACICQTHAHNISL